MAFEKRPNCLKFRQAHQKKYKVGEQAIALQKRWRHALRHQQYLPDRGGPLGEGQLEGSVVTCPWHGWQFNVATGKAVQNPNAGSVASLRTPSDEVYVDLAKPV